MARFASKAGMGADGTRSGESVSATAELTRGAVLHQKYRLEELLGEGGMGAVWRAHHLQLDLPVALKVLRGDGPKNEVLSERLRIEARAAARLVHPAIVRVLDVDSTEAGDPFIVMELLDGESLASVLERGLLSGEGAVQTLLPIAEALVLAHAKGIIHRDLKPHNVFLAKDGERVQPKLLDFGIAKLTASPMPAGNLTETGILLGSPDYMCPEQARGRNDVDHRADIWQFCVVLYEAVSGHTPFDGDNYNALMRAIVEDDPTPLQLSNSLDQRLVDVIFWGLAKDRADRPSTVHELGGALAQWLLDRGVTEDVCGTSLSAKWIARPVQKSLPAAQPEDVPLPARSDTLVSPGTPNRSPRPSGEPAPVVIREILTPQGDSASAPSRAASPGRRAAWVAVAGALLLAGAGWAMTRVAPEPRRSAQLPRPSSAQSLVPSAPTRDTSSPSASLPPLVTIAATPPAPPSTDSVATSSLRHSAPPARPAAVTSKPQDPSPNVDKPPAAKPARVDHDETHELLQAY